MPASDGVAVAFQAAAGERTRAGHQLHGRFGGRGDGELLDAAGQSGGRLDRGQHRVSEATA